MKAVGGLSAVVTYHQVLMIHKGKKLNAVSEPYILLYISRWILVFLWIQSLTKEIIVDLNLSWHVMEKLDATYHQLYQHFSSRICRHCKSCMIR
jgi:hypothetical protein